MDEQVAGETRNRERMLQRNFCTLKVLHYFISLSLSDYQYFTNFLIVKMVKGFLEILSLSDINNFPLETCFFVAWSYILNFAAAAKEGNNFHSHHH